MLFLEKILIKFFKKQISLSQLNAAKKSSKPLRLVIGSGYTRYNNWITTDITTLDITKEEDWQKYFKENSISSILAEHVFEHLTEHDRDNAIRNIYKYLGFGGNFRIAIPDGLHPNKDYIESVKPGGVGPGSDDHKFLYNYKTMSEILEKVGFKIALLEYYNEQGRFCLNSWSSELGMVKRTAINDPRNKDGIINYSSLLLDAIK